MSQTIELNPGEVKVNFQSPTPGKVSFADLGMKNDDLFFRGGLLRMVFDLEGIGDHDYYAVPTIEVAYLEEMGETHWQCEFNDEVILDKTDHHGHSTVMLLNRNRLGELEHHHQNELTVHAEFPGPVHLDAEKSYINLFK